MKRKFYRGFFTNGSVKNIGKVDKGKYGYEIQMDDDKSIIPKNTLVKYNFCYCKRNINGESFKSIEKRQPICSICDIKCMSPEQNDYHGYKTKSKKKCKGLNKLKKDFNQFYINN